MTSGALSVSGARVTSQDSYAPGESIEIVATFSPQSFEHVGMAQDRTLASGPWALFSTRDTTGSLFARVSTGTASFDVPIPGIAFVGVLIDPTDLDSLDLRLWLAGSNLSKLYDIAQIPLPNSPPCG